MKNGFVKMMKKNKIYIIKENMIIKIKNGKKLIKSYNINKIFY